MIFIGNSLLQRFPAREEDQISRLVISAKNDAGDTLTI